jgi:hypothetical protein
MHIRHVVADCLSHFEPCTADLLGGCHGFRMHSDLEQLQLRNVCYPVAIEAAFV